MVFPPLGLFFVAAAAQQAGHQVDYVDLNVDSLPDGYDAYLVTGTTPQRKSMLGIPSRVQGLMIAGGPEAALNAPELQKSGYDYVVCGEGEKIIPTLLEQEWPKGIIYTERILDTGTIPHPTRMWQGRYYYQMNGFPVAHTIVSRGCPWSCKFCFHSRWENKVTFMPLDWVQEEIDLLTYLGYGGVMFFDDTFTIKKDRVIAIGEMLKKHDLDWRCFVRADTVTPELAKLLAFYGCREVGMGVESGSDRILRLMTKKTTYQKNLEAVNVLRDAGIHTKAFIIVGLPGETLESVRDTKRWLREAQPYDWDSSVFVPYPGTPVFNNPGDYDIHWDTIEADHMWWKGIPGQYEALCSTNALSRQDVVRCRDEIDAIKKEIRV